jgi:hypothetical protein
MSTYMINETQRQRKENCSLSGIMSIGIKMQEDEVLTCKNLPPECTDVWHGHTWELMKKAPQ